MLSKIVDWNHFLWCGPILILLFFTHLTFTFRSHVIQRFTFRAFRKLLSENGHDSAWSALSTTLAATLGTGNIIGMSAAIALGGPGAVFWCWLTGVFGMATTYAECNLSLQHAHEPGGSSGPMHLLRHVVGKPFVAQIYAIALVTAALFVSATLQSNALADSVQELMGFSPSVTGFIVCLLTCPVFFGFAGGIKRVCSVLVPAMSLFFFGGCVLLLLTKLGSIPRALGQILHGAFGPSYLPSRSVIGGICGYSLGVALRHGVAKGLFTNEAGLGTATLAAVENRDSTIIEQSLFSMIATFIDTVVLCGLCGVMLVACMLSEPEAFAGAGDSDLVTVAFGGLPIFGQALLHISIITFAFATLLGWCFLGQKAAEYLAGKTGGLLYRFLYLIMIWSGAAMQQNVLLELTDFINLFLLLPNLYLLYRLRKKVIYPHTKQSHDR